MTKIESLAQYAYAQIEPPPNKDGSKGSILVTIAILGLIIQLVMAVWTCWKNKPADSLAKIHRPNFLQRLYLRRLVRKVLAKHGIEGQADAVVKALLAMGKTMDEDDLRGVLSETANDHSIYATAVEYGVL